MTDLRIPLEDVEMPTARMLSRVAVAERGTVASMELAPSHGAESMDQRRIAFPGESTDHADRLLRTADFLLTQGRLRAACELLKAAEGMTLLPDQEVTLSALADRLLTSSRQPPAVQHQTAPCRLLRFRSRETRAAASSATASRSSSVT